MADDGVVTFSELDARSRGADPAIRAKLDRCLKVTVVAR